MAFIENKSLADCPKEFKHISYNIFEKGFSTNWTQHVQLLDVEQNTSNLPNSISTQS